MAAVVKEYLQTVDVFGWRCTRALQSHVNRLSSHDQNFDYFSVIVDL
jgi:hypothetical protein